MLGVAMPDLLKHKTLTAYLIAKLRATSIWIGFDRILKYTRRFFFLTRILRYIRIVVTIIETSTVLILFAALFIALIPILAVLIIMFTVSELIIGTRILKSDKLRLALSREHIYIISDAGVFGEGYARELADRGSSVFILSASLQKRFISLTESNGIYFIRHAFFFRLKRRYLAALTNKTVYLL